MNRRAFLMASTMGLVPGDVITDFAPVTDNIDLMGIDADSTVAGNQAFHWVDSAAFTGTRDDERRGHHAHGHTRQWPHTFIIAPGQEPMSQGSGTRRFSLRSSVFSRLWSLVSRLWSCWSFVARRWSLFLITDP